MHRLIFNRKIAFMKKDIDMLNGSIADKIIRFAIPLAITGILQQVFNAMDVMVVGRFADKHAMAAVGSNTPIVGLIVNLLVGLSLGANITIARYIGQKREEDVKKAVHTSIIIALLAGVIFGVVGLLIAKPLLNALSVPPEVLPMASAYLRIYFTGLPVVLLYNFEAAIFRAYGDTKTPLICLIIAGILNVVLNMYFVIVLHRNADGVAIATVLSNLVSSVTMFIILIRTDRIIKVEPKRLRIDPHVFRVIIRLGLPAGIQSGVFSFSNIIIQSAINSLGPDVMAASSAAFNVEIFTYFILNAFGQACTTFIGQNYGAGNKERCKKITRYSYIMDIIATALFSAMIIWFSASILGFFSDDPNVISLGVIRVKYITYFQVVNATMEILSGTMRGYGNSVGPAVITLFGVVGTRIFWVYAVFPFSRTFRTLLTCYPISWIVTAIILITYYFIKYGRKKEAS